MPAVRARTTWDVVVVGGGNAGLCAGIAAAEAGASVCVVERAPPAWAGGNSWFTAGAYRTTYGSLGELHDLLPALTDERASRIDLDPYESSHFVADLERVTQGLTDPVLARVVAEESAAGMRWLAAHGVAWRLQFDRQSFVLDDRTVFWGNLPMGTVGGGPGLIRAELAAAARSGVDVLYDLRARALLTRDGRVTGIRCDAPGGGTHEIHGSAVVLASGGFQGDPAKRVAHLGPGWDRAKIRGTPYDTGDGIDMALEVGAARRGQWEGCHAIAWDAGAPPHGDRELTNRFSRQAYPFGLVINRDGRRFVDEGADLRNYTYARYGAEILRQPDGIAFQLFDATTLPFIDGVDYETAAASRVQADSIAALAEAIGTDPHALERTVADYNAGVQPGPFDPARKDGKGTVGVEPPKSNWAQRYESPPFVAFAVTCGITFTFGGIAVGESGSVLRDDGSAIPGLFAAGELVGGLFHHNYPGGSGLAAGTVMGRRAGASAAAEARRRPA